MKYYRLRHTLNTKILGHYPQVKDIKYNCHVDNGSKFIQHYYFKKIDFTPCVANPILYAKSKKTDLIEQLGIGFSHRLVMSLKLKNILEKYTKDSFQYFQCSIFHKKNEDENYWIMNPYKFKQEFIDFNKSEALLRIRKPKGGTKLELIKITSFENFNEIRELNRKDMSMLRVYKIILKNKVYEDFFVLNYIEGGIGYFVSEKLKKEIEDINCTGIEFQPLDLTFNEWLSERKENE